MEYESIIHPFLARKLGSGKFGTVYLIDQDGSPRALKIVLKHPSASLLSGKYSDILEQGKEEYQTMRNLQGIPGIPEVYDLVQFPHEREIWYGFTQEYIPGPTLLEKMYSIRKRHRKVTLDFLLKLAYFLSETLLGIQSRGYAHRDIKPENIVLQEPYYRPYLVDFGGSCPLPECQETFGTPLYFDEYLNTHPENRRYDLADVFSLGRTLQVVWQGDTKSSLGTIVTRVDPEAITLLRPLLLAEPSRRTSLSAFHDQVVQMLLSRNYHLDEPLVLYSPDDTVVE